MFDAKLGHEIQKLLQQHKLENPVDFKSVAAWPSQQSQLNSKFANFLAELGLVEAEAIPATANRLLNYWCHELFTGLDYARFPQINLQINEFNYCEPLFAEQIEIRTTCEHHLVPITGRLSLAYRPGRYLIGLNKLNQIVNFLCKRPQLQERLTLQIAIVIQYLLATPDVAVVIKARHECMYSGLNPDHYTRHTTSELSGCFSNDTVLKAKLLND